MANEAETETGTVADTEMDGEAATEIEPKTVAILGLGLRQIVNDGELRRRV